MLKKNSMTSLSDRFNKYKKYHNSIIAHEAFIVLKSKRDYNSELYNKDNKTIDFLAKTTNVFDLEKLKENHNKYLVNQIHNINNTNNDEKSNKRIFYNFFNNDKNEKTKKFILSKKKMLQQILYDEGKNPVKEKSNINNNNFNVNLNYKRYKGIVLVNSISMPELEINKKNNKNGIEENLDSNSLCLKSQDNYTKKFLQEKLYQINMNKIALFKKIKFAGLKKFCCKDLKLNNAYNNNKKNDINYNIHQNNQNKNKDWKQNNFLIDNNINNCNEIIINSIKEKVRSYFIGKFENIKDYFDDWDEQGLGKITIKDIYRYLNNKIKYKISKEETKRLFGYFCKKNYFDLQNFKYFFFEEPSNEKLSIKLNKFFNYNQMLMKSSSDGLLQFNRSKNDNNILCYEKYKYNELLNLIKEQKNKIILNQISVTKDKDNKIEEINYNEFYNLIISIINNDNKKINFNNEIKKIFMKYKLKDSENINIKDFFEKINDKKDIDKKIKSIYSCKNIKRQINPGYTTFYELIKKKANLTNCNLNSKIISTNKDTIFSQTNCNSKNSSSKKKYVFNQTNYLFNKKIKDFEENKKINKYNKNNEDNKVNKHIELENNKDKKHNEDNKNNKYNEDNKYNENNEDKKYNEDYKDNKHKENNKKTKFNKINNHIKESKSHDMKTAKNKTSIKHINFKALNKGRILKERLSITNENIERKHNNINEHPKILKFELPKISKYIRANNKNSDIIDLL